MPRMDDIRRNSDIHRLVHSHFRQAFHFKIILHIFDLIFIIIARCFKICQRTGRFPKPLETGIKPDFYGSISQMHTYNSLLFQEGLSDFISLTKFTDRNSCIQHTVLYQKL